MSTPYDAELARIADLSDEELSALEADITAEFEKADQSGDEEAMTSLADALDLVLTEKQRREGSTTEAVAAAADSTPAPEGTNPVSETITSTEVPEDRKPLATVASTTVITAGADIPGTPAGTVFSSRTEMAKAFASRVNTLRRLTGGDGEQVVIASIKTSADAEHSLFANDPEGNFAKIQRASNPLSAITAAATGWCAPLTTRYDVFDMGVADRPVRDSLPGFNADRGGIRYYPGFSLADATSVGHAGTGIWDDVTDTKKVGTVACPTEQECEIYAVTKAMKFSNVTARVFPELVDSANNITMVAHARLAESNLLAAIKAASVALAAPAQVAGTIRQLLNDVAAVAAFYRDVNRLGTSTPLRVILPAWIIDSAGADITLTGQDRDLISGLSESEINEFFSRRHINVTWALDSAVPATHGGGFYDAAAATFPNFLKAVDYPIFVEGSFLFLDGGTLDLGIVRDSTLVTKNEYVQFAETFEGICNVGAKARWITSHVEVTGCFSNGAACHAPTP